MLTYNGGKYSVILVLNYDEKPETKLMKLSEDLAWRGLIKDKTFSDNHWLDSPNTFYHGIDASGDSMTIGNLAAMMMARRLINGGWQAVLLAGGATSLIGDPKETMERELASREVIQKNVVAIKEQIKLLFDGQDFQMVDNFDWFKGVKYLDFLREVGKNYSMSELMQREFITERMSSGISYAEFSYSLIQGYDYWKLYQAHNVNLQIGGSDQWGNMLSGVSLIRKKESIDVHALSMPLVIDKSTGRKFGKSEDGAVWLDAKKTTVFKFYQFWYNVGDDDVEDYLKIFTLLNKEQIQELVTKHYTNPAKRVAQKQLAYSVTNLVHSKAQAEKQQRISEALAGERSIDELNDSEIATLREELPSQKIHPGTSIIEVLVETRLASSNSEARRLVEGASVYVNGQKLDKAHLESADFKKGKLMLRRGKAHKDSALIELA
jgi:tyrosyl-tRNA synthetase